METKQVIFNDEIIYARELTFAEYEEYTVILRDRNESNFDRQTLNIMARFAEGANGQRRFGDAKEFDDKPARQLLGSAYAFGYALADINTVTQADTDAMRKN